MNTLIGIAVGVLSMAVLVGMMAAIGTLVFYNVDNLLALWVGIALGVIAVAAVVGYLA